MAVYIEEFGDAFLLLVPRFVARLRAGERAVYGAGEWEMVSE
jgi:hypothetical protein